MNKKTLIIISSAFVLSVSGINFTNAQFDNIPDPVPAADRCVPPRVESARSPSEACQVWERIVYCSAGNAELTITINGSGDECTVTSGFKQNGTHRYYYSGDEYCREESIGTPYHSKTCARRTDIAQPTTKATQPTKQQQKTAPKVVAPKEQPKTTTTSDNRAWNQLLSLSNMITKATIKTEDAIRGFFDSIFNFFRKK